MINNERWLGSFRKVSEKLEVERPEVVRYAQDLYGRIKTEKGQAKYVNGLLIMTCLTNDRFYKYLTASTLLVATSKGSDVSTFRDLHFVSSEIVNSGSISIDKASDIAANEKMLGKKVGLLHGHDRFFTPGSLLNVILAGEECDSLFLGMEANWRSRMYKGSETPYYNRQRENIMVLWPGLAEHVVRISRLAYTNQGYRRMVMKISPAIYFGNESYPLSVRGEMKLRAELAGVEYKELKYIPSFSTTEYLLTGGKTEENYSLLLRS